jgi:hypothetical protein
MAERNAQIVYDNVAEGAGVRGQLFSGLKFFMAQRLPLRSTFLEMVKNNGGEIVKLEKAADYLIVDHMRKDTPPGGISYQFIEASIRSKSLADPRPYAVGPPAASPREVGSVLPAKTSTRRQFSADDDRILMQWIAKSKAQGAYISGNVIYQQLEQKVRRNPVRVGRSRLTVAVPQSHLASVESEIYEDISEQAAH